MGEATTWCRMSSINSTTNPATGDIHPPIGSLDPRCKPLVDQHHCPLGLPQMCFLFVSFCLGDEMMRVVLLFDEIVFLGEVVMINVSESQMFFC